MKILITGGTNGMGKGVAKALASIDNQNFEIIILCRSKELGEATIKEIESLTSNKNLSLILCDLAKLSDVKKAIDEIQTKHTYLDAIFINAGLGYTPKRVETEDGLDSHFQVNYLSQFMLILNLLNLLENSSIGGRVIFNVTQMGKIYWDDIQMKNKWGFEKAIHQSMFAKRMFFVKLNKLYRNIKNSKISFVGFEISKTVWSNQINIIPFYMKLIASIMKLFGKFITIDECGQIMSPLFTESQEESFKKSGKLITYKNNKFIEINENKDIFDTELQDKLWNISLSLCNDDKTTMITEKIMKK